MYKKEPSGFELEGSFFNQEKPDTIRCPVMAEKEGFEPSIPFWGIHDFQSCALGQLRDFSMSALDAWVFYTITIHLSRGIFIFLQKTI